MASNCFLVTDAPLLPSWFRQGKNPQVETLHATSPRRSNATSLPRNLSPTRGIPHCRESFPDRTNVVNTGTLRLNPFAYCSTWNTYRKNPCSTWNISTSPQEIRYCRLTKAGLKSICSRSPKFPHGTRNRGRKPEGRGWQNHNRHQFGRLPCCRRS